MKALQKFRSHLSDKRKLFVEYRKAGNATPHSNPVLIFGNQKSGTSAIAGLLGAATGQRVQIDFRGAWEPYISRVFNAEISIEDFVKKNAYSFSAPLIKEPGLTFVANELLTHFGAEKGIFIVRHPLQNIRSILNRLDIPGNLDSIDLAKGQLPNKTWHSIMNGHDLNIQGHYIDVQARRWAKAVGEYKKAPDRYHLVKYEDFIQDKDGTIQSLSSSFGLEAPHDIGHLLDHSFQPKGKSDVNLEEFFGQENLQRIFDICGDDMALFGYE